MPPRTTAIRMPLLVPAVLILLALLAALAMSATVGAHEPDNTPINTAANTQAMATLEPVGFNVLSDDDAAARVRRSSFEPRPGNNSFNQTMPTDQQLQYYRDNVDFEFGKRVSGRFTGTTDEIIQWAAHKWGLNENHLRAIAVVESYWNQSHYSDGYTSGVDISGNPQTHAPGGGLISITASHPAAINSGLAKASTAFNVDYLGAIIRNNYEGRTTWLNDVERGREYTAGDIWGSIAVWYSGRWYANGSNEYIDRVRGELANRIWRVSGF